MIQKPVPEDHPLVTKSQEILQITLSLVETIEGAQGQKQIRFYLIEWATTISIKINTALSINDYSLQIENAIYARKAARDLQASTASLHIDNMSNVDYLKLLLAAIDEFRILLKTWVSQIKDSPIEDQNWSFQIKGNTI